MSFSLTAVAAFAHGCAEGRHGPGPDAGDARGDEPPVRVDAGAVFADASPEPDATGSDRPSEPDASVPADELVTLTYNSSLELAPDSDLVCFDEQLARDCGIDEPLTFGALGFGAHRWVVTVEGRPAT